MTYSIWSHHVPQEFKQASKFLGIYLNILLTISTQNIMLTIHSPKFSVGRTEITKNSPTFRHRRAPSAQDNYTVQSNPKNSGESPAKLSQDRKRKSQLETNTATLANKHSSRDKGTKEIIDSIQNLKQEYKALKEAYRQLIQERLKNTHEISKIRSENSKLVTENQRLLRDNERLKIQMTLLQQENQRTRRECLKLLEVQKFKAQKLEESLVEKQEYINQTLFKIRTEGDQATVIYPRHGSLVHMPQEDISLTISQDKSALNEVNINNQSQFLSFSLTSVLEESTDKEQMTLSKRRHEHVKAVSDLPPLLQHQERKMKDLPSFRKQKKDVPKLELTNLQSKTNLMNSAVPVRTGADKKISRTKNSKSFRQKQNRQTLNNNQKKKSKKLINLSGVDA